MHVRCGSLFAFFKCGYHINSTHKIELHFDLQKLAITRHYIGIYIGRVWLWWSLYNHIEAARQREGSQHRSHIGPIFLKCTIVHVHVCRGETCTVQWPYRDSEARTPLYNIIRTLPVFPVVSATEIKVPLYYYGFCVIYRMSVSPSCVPSTS